MNGNAFRINLDQEHSQAKHITGRFDLWVVMNPNFEPPALKPEPRRAIMDWGATYKAKNYYSKNGSKKWYNPRLDSPAGFCTPNENKGPVWWQADFPGEDMFEVSALSLKKRGDITKKNSKKSVRYIKSVSIEFSTDHGETWEKYKNGDQFPTGSTKKDSKDLERKIMIEPPIIANSMRVVIDPKYMYNPDNRNVHGRFDFWATKVEEEKEPTEEGESNDDALPVPR